MLSGPQPPSTAKSQSRDKLISSAQDEAYSTYCDATYFGSLNGLRCLSIMAVIWHHGPGSAMSGFGFRGMLGVHLFFAISGFLITTLLLREKKRAGKISLKKFYFRRTLRIFPLYYTVLGLYVALVVVLGRRGEEQFFQALPFFVTYTSNLLFREDVVIFGFAWSLATEEQFYCTWPWIERYLGGRRALVLMCFFAVAVTGWQVWNSGVDLSAPLYERILATIAPAILWGVLLAHLLHERLGHAIAIRLFGYRWSSSAALMLLLVLIAAGSPNGIIYLVMAVVVGSCVIREDHWLAPILHTKLFVQVGVVSYGMYLFHNLIYDGLGRVENFIGVPSLRSSLIEFALCALITLVVASLSYRYYESRFLKLKARYSS